MKSTIIKSTAFILSFVLLFSIICVLPASAASTPLRESCVTDHFTMLRKYSPTPGDNVEPVPPNMDGTCVFVSMSMLLSFYDFYWRDDFVVNAFDTVAGDMGWTKGEYNSNTDTLSKTFESYLESDAWSISTLSNYNFALANSDIYLQSNLIDMNSELPLYDWPGILDFQARDALEYYLYTKCGFDASKVTVNIYKAYDINHSKEEMINIAKEKIDSGNPVIFMGLNADLTPALLDGDAMIEWGHAMIGYDTFVNNKGEQDIRLHIGYNWNNPTASIRTTEYTHLNSIIWLEINEENLPHQCTDAYHDTYRNTDVCACYVYYNTHPAHQSHNYQFNGCDSETHFDKCYCGAGTNVESHNLTYSYYNPLQHYENCSDCVYSGAVNHEYTIPCSPTNTGHSLKCACGATSSATESHYDHRYTSANSSYHNIYCKCGYLIGSEVHQMVSTGLGGRCTHCGYTSKEIPGPGQVIMGKEDEEPTTE